jgi:hypothetical protein
MNDAFLWFIGAYNVFGAFVMLMCISDSGGDRLLRQWMQILAESYNHGRYGAIWVWFSAILTFFLGVLMLLATRWNCVDAKKDVALMVVVVYALALLLAINCFRFTQRYDRNGLVALYILWPAQIAWGMYYVWTVK